MQHKKLDVNEKRVELHSSALSKRAKNISKVLTNKTKKQKLKNINYMEQIWFLFSPIKAPPDGGLKNQPKRLKIGLWAKFDKIMNFIKFY